jgi:hypothetical protein
LYSELGVKGYKENYAAFDESIEKCLSLGALLGLTCPKKSEDVSVLTAKRHLLAHADNTFSSVTTSGAPMPFWSEKDGTGSLLVANPTTGLLYPVSGSGVNMSAPMDSLTTYLSSFVFQPEVLVDPMSKEWQDMVETNPMYAWFMASLTPSDPGTSKLLLYHVILFLTACW